MKIGLRTWPEREALLVVLIALHSVVVGAVLLFASGWALRFGGWPDTGSYFFTRQGGIFHVVIAAIYSYEYHRHRSIAPIVIAKTTAVVFLGILAWLGEPPLVLASAAADGLMAAILVWVHRQK